MTYRTYLRSSLSTTAVTVVSSAFAFSSAACHNSSGTRMPRAFVLGALGMSALRRTGGDCLRPHGVDRQPVLLGVGGDLAHRLQAREVFIRGGRTRLTPSMPYPDSTTPNVQRTPPAGRWPTNVVLDEEMAEELDRQSGERTSGVLAAHHTRNPKEAGILGAYGSADGERGYGDTGGASRFFPTFRYNPEEYPCSISSDATSTDTSGSIDPAPSEAGASSSAAPAELLTSTRFRYEAKAPASERPRVDGIAHPHGQAPRPHALARPARHPTRRHRARALRGSGTTVEACLLERFHCIAIEKTDDYLPLILARIHRRTDPVAAIRLAGDDGGLLDLIDEAGEPA